MENENRDLSRPRRLLLGAQHLFAMFGATVLVPALTGLSVSGALFFAGVGTLLFHLITRGQVPAFLGSSFAFLGGYAAVAPMLAEGPNSEMLPYACAGVAAAGLVYPALAFFFRKFGPDRVMRFFPPVVTGPIIICIGLSLAGSAIGSCRSDWPVALTAVIVVLLSSVWGKGMVRIVPILLGVAVSYALAMAVDPAARAEAVQAVAGARWLGWPIRWEETALSILGPGFDGGKLLSALVTIVPIALAAIVEHIGDMCAISSTVGKNFVAEPGLHRTLLGDGVATTVSALLGGPANTTYGENTGVLALTRVYDPGVVRLAAVFSAALSFCPKFTALIGAMPEAVMGGVSLVLYGMIAAVGARNLTEARVDFTKSRNVLVAAMILVLGTGITYSGAIQITLGDTVLSLSGLAVAALTGIFLNAVLPAAS